MKIDWTLVARYAAPLIALFVGAALTRLIEKRPRLATYLANAAAIEIPGLEGGSMRVHTHSIVVRNAGRKAAINVRLGHFDLPAFSVFPPHDYQVVDVPGGHEIVFPTLVPMEEVTVAYLYFPPRVWNEVNTYTRSDEGFARVLKVLPTEQLPPWLSRLALFLVVVGGFTTIFVLGQFLARIMRLVYGD